MSKNVRILAEVSDEINENLVIPMKKQKTFGKLVVKLLEGYYNVDAIRGYIEGTIDIEEKEDNDELQESLREMQRSLGILDMSLDEAEAVVEEGKSTFEEGAYGSSSSEKSKDGYVTKDEVEDIVKSSINELKELILNMQVVSKEVVKEVPKQTTTVVKDKQKVVEVKKEETMAPIVHDGVIREISEEDKREGEEALNSLLDGLDIEF